MMNKVTDLGHMVSALAGSVMHARTKKLMHARAMATGALLAGVFLFSTTNAALAGQSLQNYAGEVSEKTSVVVDIVAYICYIGGAILSALGIVDLKKHVEQPTQVKLKDGLAKLGFGGILLGLPFVSGVMLETMRGSGGEAVYDDFNRSGLKVQ